MTKKDSSPDFKKAMTIQPGLDSRNSSISIGANDSNNPANTDGKAIKEVDEPSEFDRAET